MKRKILSLITTLLLTLGVVSTGCSNTNTSSSSMPDTTTTSSHEHTYSSSYEYDDTYHWHPSTCGHDVKGDKGRHEFTSETSENGDTVYTCSICHYSYSDGNNDDKDTYTVTWKNYDGTILEIDNDVSYGTTPTYDGATPIKESDDRYNYNFAGWSPEVEPVTEDITYTAVFTSEEITYTIDFDLNGGTSSSYKGSIEVTTFSKDIFFFDCVKEDWQFRGWEYNGEKIFDEKGNQLKNVTLVDNMIFRAIYSQTVKLTITTNMPEAGTITGEGEYPYNTYVDVSVTPNQGYKFVGWYYQNTLLSNEEDYKYMMWDKDITLEAVWSEYEIREDDNGKYAVIIGYDDSITDVIIPENVLLNGEEIPVKEISQTAFKNNQKVKSVTVSNKVTTIDEYAFAGCTSLESIYLPTSVKTIENNAFYNCSNLESVTISENSQLISIGSSAFRYCFSLTSIYIPDSVTTIGSYAFDYCYILTIYCEASSRPSDWSSYWNPSGRPVVWNSYKGIYGNFNGLEYIAYHDSECKSYIVITGYNGSNYDVVIPEYIEVNGEQIVVKEISKLAFKNAQIISIYIPDSVTTIGPYAFEFCSSLTTVRFGENSQLTTIGKDAFFKCSSLTSIYIPDSVTTISYSAFEACSNLTTVTISENSQLTSIENYAFYNCSSLTSIYIPNSVTSIDSNAFRYCSKLTIYCESSSEPSGWSSFWNPSGRPVVWNSYLGVHDTLNGLEYAVCIDDEGKSYIVITGYNGSNSDVVIPEYIEVNGEQIVVKEISNNAFEDNTKITSIYISDSVTTIGRSAFDNCSNLTTVTISENSQLTSIGYYAFSGCISLTSIYIPGSVTSIGDYAFSGCSKLTIYCETSSKPSGWDSSWNYSQNSSDRPVVWNCTYEEYLDTIA